jgi:ribonuclease BN (tRNA processing enzyme)
VLLERLMNITSSLKTTLGLTGLVCALTFAIGSIPGTVLAAEEKSTSWMGELGNGDVFLFDIGTGSMENLFGLRPDFSKIDKVFLSHLHSDHFGDLDAFIVGSWLSGRYTPLHVYGGSGETPELGTKAAVEAVMKALAWDIKYARNADFAIHECFPTPAGLAAFNDWEMRPSTYVTSYIHTPPPLPKK